MREKLFGHLAQYHVFRITPACAGKTRWGSRTRRWFRDHTRVCGKNLPLTSLLLQVLGSHPRVREKHWFHAWWNSSGGITPACAGKTFPILRPNPLWRDHPRVCGKNFKPLSVTLACAGSPPRVREKLIRDGVIAYADGITPACAGKTLSLWELGRWRWDHPRVCGKNCTYIYLFVRYLGSPPRVREKR